MADGFDLPPLSYQDTLAELAEQEDALDRLDPRRDYYERDGWEFGEDVSWWGRASRAGVPSRACELRDPDVRDAA